MDKYRLFVEQGKAGMVFATSMDLPDLFIGMTNEQWEHGWRDAVRFTVESALCPAGDREVDIRLPQERPTGAFTLEAGLV